MERQTKTLHRADRFDEAELLGLVHDAVIASDVKGIVQSWNPGAERVYGYAPSEMIGRNISEVYFPEDLALLPRGTSNPVQAAANGRELTEITLRRRHKSGYQMLISLRIATIRDRAGTLIGFVTCSNDITQRKCAEDALFLAHAELEQRIVERTRDLSEANVRLQAEIAQRRNAETELRASRERLDHLLLTSPGVLYSSGLTGNSRHTFPSRNAASMFGRGTRESPRQPVFRLDRVHPEDRARVAAFPATVASEGQGCIEYRFLHGDGAWRMLRDSAVAVRDESGEPVEIVGYCLDLAEETEAGEARRERERLHLFAEALLTTQEAERKRISRELHDDLSQRLATLILDIGMLEQNLPPQQSPLRFALKALKVQAAGISDSVRAIALQLHSAGLEQFGLPVVLGQECTVLAGRTGMCVTFRSRAVPEILPENVSLCLYRVAQECLRNAFRHSQASEVRVALAGTANGIRLRVKDNGIGFDADQARGRNSLGLISMSERVRLLNGILKIQSRGDTGTLVEVHVPLTARNRAATAAPGAPPRNPLLEKKVSA